MNRLYYSGAYTAADEDGSRGDVRYNYIDDKAWSGIRAGWMFIENVERVPDMDNAEKARLTAEAKVLIASRYFDMFRHFGGLPLVDKTYGVQAVYEVPRATAAVYWMLLSMNRNYPGLWEQMILIGKDVLQKRQQWH